MNMERNPASGCVTSRREIRRQDRRDAILTVAARSFLEQGYAGTTMSGIAATLGGSKGTLWNYFGSKEELFAAVIDHVTIEYRAGLSEILAEPCDDLRLTLKRFCTGIMDKVTTPDAISLHRLVVAEAGRFPEMGRIFYDRAPLQTYVLLAEFLEGVMARGLIRAEEPMQAARLLVTLCVSGYQQKMLMGLIETATTPMIAAEVERATDLFMRAYALEDGTPS
ncbi:TetR/AcrR family transcriptional regulator [Sphingobium sufflavum]|uniref:TetR/AcrR family transcriptional regulator n=1 Tax=Sphingobium sufflavum TaxID=1129547 RepID=UPI001F28FFA8|nr:TetR/AcrR family transcriptional regulator [Sphingobium sufflavum]